MCGLTMYTGPDGSALPLYTGIGKWDSSQCGGAYYAAYQTTPAGSGVVSGGGAYQSNAMDCNLADADAYSGWTWFRLSRLTDGTVHAEWSTEDSTAPPTSGWVLLSTFSISSSPDRVGLLHKTGTTAASTCSFKDFSAPSDCYERVDNSAYDLPAKLLELKATSIAGAIAEGATWRRVGGIDPRSRK